MAKKLKQIFTNSDQVEQTFIINAWHVSQSVDAFTGIDDYDISVSGSMHITGTLSTDDDVFFSGLNSLPQNDVVIINTSDGQLFYTSSGAFKDYIYSASFDSSSAQLNFFGSGSAFDGSVDLSFLSDSVDYVYSASFESSSGQLTFYGSGSGYNGSVDLSDLTGSVDYVYSASFDSSSAQLDFFGSGSALNGSVDLSFLSSSVDYVSNVSYDNSTSTLSFTGVGSAFDGDISLSNLDDNGGGFTLNYSGSVILNENWSNTGFPQKAISTDASHITASGYNEWHFSDIGKSLFGGPGNQQQYDDDGLIGDGDTLFTRITGSVTGDGQLLVRIYDDKHPEYDFYYVNQGAATLGNAGSGGNDLILNLKWIGGRSYGQSNSSIPNGTNPNNANVSFAFIGGGGGGVGPTGPTGPAGPTGPTGPTGPAGSGTCAMTRPGTANGITIYGTTDLAGVGNYTNFFSVAGGTPSSNGDISVDDSDATQVANIRIYDTDDSGDDHDAFFDNISAGSQITIVTNGVGAFQVDYDVVSVTDNGAYHTFNVTHNSGTGTFTTTQTFDQLIFAPEDPTYQLSEGYNRIYVTNQSGITTTLRLAAPNNPDPNECIHVELAKANTGIVNIDYWVRGYSGGTYEKIKPVYSTDSTLERISIGNSSGKVFATFKTWAIGTGADNFGLILEGAEKFNNA